MPSTDKPSRRWWLQVRLRTLLVVTLVVAGICGYVLRPKRRELDLPGMKIQESFRTVTRKDGDSDVTEAEVRHGYWMLRDSEERRWASGNFSSGRISGLWTVYHPNGEPAYRGRARRGQRVGRWRSWYDTGQVQTDVSYGGEAIHRNPIRVEWRLGTPDWKPYSSDHVSVPASRRHGPTRCWWPNGRLRSKGQYRNDQRSGTWTSYDQQGRQTATGTYLRGQRHGVWELNTIEGAVEQRAYVNGRHVENLDEFIAKCEADFSSDRLATQLAAARRLEQLGSLAVPVLQRQFADRDTHQRGVLTVRTLGRIGPDAGAVVTELKTLSDDPDPAMRLHVQLALLSIDGATTERLNAALDHAKSLTDARARIEAFARLFELDEARRTMIGDLLFSEATPPTNDVRRQNVIAKLSEHDEATLDLLEPYVRDGDQPTRELATDLLIAVVENSPYTKSFREKTNALLKIVEQDPVPAIRNRAKSAPLWMRGQPFNGSIF